MYFLQTLLKSIGTKSVFPTPIASVKPIKKNKTVAYLLPLFHFIRLHHPHLSFLEIFGDRASSGREQRPRHLFRWQSSGLDLHRFRWQRAAATSKIFSGKEQRRHPHFSAAKSSDDVLSFFGDKEQRRRRPLIFRRQRAALRPHCRHPLDFT